MFLNVKRCTFAICTLRKFHNAMRYDLSLYLIAQVKKKFRSNFTSSKFYIFSKLASLR